MRWKIGVRPPRIALRANAALALRHGTHIPPLYGSKSNATNCAGFPFASLATRERSRMKPKLERVEIEPARRRDHDLAVDNAAVRQPFQKGRVKLRKVAVERSQVATLNEDLGYPVKNDGAKAIPFGLIQERCPHGELLGKLREHRLEIGGASAKPVGGRSTSRLGLFRLKAG